MVVELQEQCDLPSRKLPVLLPVEACQSAVLDLRSVLGISKSPGTVLRGSLISKSKKLADAKSLISSVGL